MNLIDQFLYLNMIENHTGVTEAENVRERILSFSNLIEISNAAERAELSRSTV